MDKKDQVVRDEQGYLEDVLNKFNSNQDDPDLTNSEKTILKKITSVENEIKDLLEQFNSIHKEVTERQDKMNAINQKILLKRGQTQGLIDSLLALR